MLKSLAAAGLAAPLLLGAAAGTAGDDANPTAATLEQASLSSDMDSGTSLALVLWGVLGVGAITVGSVSVGLARRTAAAHSA